MADDVKMRDIFALAKQQCFQDIHFWRDEKSQLEAIIAIHSTALGPALGGCRFIPYASTEQALDDALRLAKSMSYKSAINQLPFGGGKAVILKPALINNRQQLFKAFGEFVESLKGRYVTAMDSGTTIDDMNAIASTTRHVCCTSTTAGHGISSGDPSPYTAMGVYCGIKAAVKYRFDKDSLYGVRIAIQGVGHVGYQLGKLLAADGAKLMVADIDQSAVTKMVAEFSAQPVAVDDIYQVSCDVFSPCALGQVISSHSIEKLSAAIVAGAANNQLQYDQLANVLLQRGVLYAPDYVINSGGILQIAYVNDEQQLNEKFSSLYRCLIDIFSLSESMHLSTVDIANQKAELELSRASNLKLSYVERGV